MLVTDGAFRADGTFVPWPAHNSTALTEAFRRAVLRLFVRRGIFEVDHARAMLAWPHAGSHVHDGVWVPATRPGEARPATDRLPSSGQTAIQIPSVKRRPASSPNEFFRRLAVARSSVVHAVLEVLLSLLFALSGGTRGSRRIWVVRKSGRRQLSHDVDGPWCVKEFHALAAPDSVTSIRARSGRPYPARWSTAWGAAGASGRIRCASYGTPSRHIA